MTFKVADRVKETTTTTGTGTVTLLGAVSGFQAFSVIGDGNTTHYTILDANGTGWEVGIGTYTLSGTTLARTTVLASSNAGSAITLSTGTHTVFCGLPGVVGGDVISSAQGITPGGRLTLTTAVPVTTSDVTGATTVYYTPYLSNIINLWTGSRWSPIVFAEVSLALGTITSALPYDVFGFLNAGALNTELLAWTNGTTRATDVTIQDGRFCKSGDKTRLYLGTFYTTATTTTEDSGGGTTTQVGGKRFLWNMYNRVRRSMSVFDGGTSWTYTTGTIRQTNATSGNKVEFVCGRPIDVSANVAGGCVVAGATAAASTGLGLDSTTAYSGWRSTSFNNIAGSSSYYPLTGSYEGYPGIGYHYLAWLEKGGGTGCQFIGNVGDTGVQCGLNATVIG